MEPENLLLCLQAAARSLYSSQMHKFYIFPP
jgi:hypothetical protein